MLAKKYKLPIQQFYTRTHHLLSVSNKPVFFIVKKNSFFVVKLKKSQLPFSRFGVSVSKKVEKSAAKRNYVRRKIYNCIIKSGLHQKPGKDVMIITLPRIKELDQNKIQTELLKLLL